MDSVLAQEMGRALNARIAERVMGWTRDCTGRCYADDEPAFLAPDGGRRRAPPYFTDDGLAMQVVARVQQLHPGWRFLLLGGDVTFGYRHDGDDDYVVDRSVRVAFGWRAEFFGDEDPTRATAERHGTGAGPTPAAAICRATLDAIEKHAHAPAP